MKFDSLMRGITSLSLASLVLIIDFATSLNPFTKETSLLLGSNVDSSIVAAFADINADRRVDIILIDPSKLALDVILMAKEGAGKRTHFLTAPSSSSSKDVILGVLPADYNGDSRLDVALMMGPKGGGGPVSVYISYGLPKRPHMTAPSSIGVSLTDQPFVLDWNGDMIADLMGQTQDGKTTVLIGNKNDTFATHKISFSAWDSPGYTAFVDVNQDYQPDIMITTKANYQFILKNKKTNIYEVGTPLIVNKPSKPTVPKVLGSPTFFDFNMENKMIMMAPACKDVKCTESLFYIYSFSKKSWTVANVSFTVSGQKWGFVPAADNTLNSFLPMPITVRVGDVDLDGFPDIVAVLQRVSGGSPDRRIGLFLGQGNGKFSLTFPVTTPNVSMVGLFDYHDTGRLGFVTVGGSPPRMEAIMQGNKEDGYFLKVMVLNGLCGGSSNCPENHPPYGLPVPGPVASYNTERPEGGRQLSMVQQITQSSYLALQLPFNIFGLGSFANYIESLDVQVPNQVGVAVNRNKEFTFIVPKSQLVVIPYPLDEPAKWRTRLFLEPFKDKKVLYIAAALLGFTFLVAIITGILHWREKKEDLQEKLQEAQKFHFDAM